MSKRKYQQKRRAEQQEETRQRIVEATVRLHETLGPRATTISAIAEEAGVQRLTVYRHFADDRALFAACSSHWIAGHPLPDPALWQGVPDWRQRSRAALAAIYGYYRANQGMLASVYRDADIPVLAEPLQAFFDFNAAVRDDLLTAAGPELAQRPAFAGTIGHVLAFPTWQSLAGRFDDEAMAALAMAWLDGVAGQAEERRDD